MPTPVNSRVVIDVCASDFAFHLGQWFHQSLLDRSIEIARQTGSSVVTTEHVESCLDHAWFDELLKRMREGSDDRAAVKRGVGKRQSREAA